MAAPGPSMEYQEAEIIPLDCNLKGVKISLHFQYRGYEGKDFCWDRHWWLSLPPFLWPGCWCNCLANIFNMLLLEFKWHSQGVIDLDEMRLLKHQDQNNTMSVSDMIKNPGKIIKSVIKYFDEISSWLLKSWFLLSWSMLKLAKDFKFLISK